VAINQKDINKLFSTLRTRIHELNNGHVATAIPKSEYRIIVYRLYFAAVQHPEIFLPLLKKEREAMNKAKHLLDSRLSLEEKAILEKEDWYWEMYVLLGEEIDEILYDLDNIIENLTLTIAVRPAAPVSTIPEMPALRWLGTERQLKSLYVLLTNNPDETKAAVIQTDEEVFKQAFGGIIMSGTLSPPQMYVDLLSIEKGEGNESVASRLVEEGIITGKIYFYYFIKSRDLQSEIMPGVYELSGTMTIPEIAHQITTKEEQFARITFPEGWDARKMAERLTKMNFWETSF